MIKNFRHHHLVLALTGYENQGLPLDLFLNQYYRTNKALGSKDRAFLNETIYHLIRWQSLLDALSSEPYNWEKRIQVFQKDTLENLRQHQSLQDYQKVSFPEWLFLKLKDQFGQAKAEQYCLVSNEQAPPTLRVNLLKTTREELVSTLEKQGIYPQLTALSPHGIVLKERRNYFEIPEFNLGHFEVQDEGSQLLSELANPKPQDHVLDFCAGSGGKTLAFAHKMNGKGQIYLHDIRNSALLQAKKRLKKAGIQNAQVIQANDPKLKKLKGKMQWVFVDAPCSGTGTLRRNPDMKWKLSDQIIQRLVGEQRSIFEQALSFLAPEGSIVYGTCSVLAEENELQTAHFIKTYDLEVSGAPLEILPQTLGADGFYGVVLKRKKPSIRGVL